jgi:hypothetical protein
MVHGFGLAYTTGSYQTNVAPWDNCLGNVRSIIAAWPGTPIAWALPLCTNSQSLAETAAGTHDAEINAILDAILAHNPVGPIYVRVGWEAATPTAWPWAATSADYMAAWQHFATLMHARSPRIKTDWTVSAFNFDGSGAEIDPTTYYPGDDYVDVIGADCYLIGSDISSAITLSRMGGKDYLAGAGFDYGPVFLSRFARAHGKQFSIAEWGIGADRPDYVRDMAHFIADPANNVAYHGYWNKNAPATLVNGQFVFPCRLSDSSNAYPLAKAAFLDCFQNLGRDYTEQAETSAYFARSNTAPATARRDVVDTLFRTLKSFGLMDDVNGSSALDGFYLLGAAEEEIACVSPIIVGGFTTTTPRTTGRISKNGAMSFIADRGYAGDGVSAYLNTNVNLVTAAPAGKFSRDSGHMGLWSLTADIPAAQQFECGTVTSNIGFNTDGKWVGRPNQSSTIALTDNGVGPGHVLWNRTGASAWASYFNGIQKKTGTDASAALTSAALNICGVSGVSYGSQRLLLYHWGRALIQSGYRQEITQINNAWQAYKQAVGA